ncbi:MAG: ribonuclease HI [Pelagibacteraceae bacterium]
MSNIKIYTDGACLGNPGKGGWGAIIINENKEEKISGKVENTTNNRMELLAVISALKYVKENSLEIFTDSKYVKDGIEQWIHTWKKNGWKTSNKKEVKNIDLWIELDQLRSDKKIIWNWVKGHSDNKYNNLVDELARNAANN